MDFIFLQICNKYIIQNAPKSLDEYFLCGKVILYLAVNKTFLPLDIVQKHTNDISSGLFILSP